MGSPYPRLVGTGFCTSVTSPAASAEWLWVTREALREKILGAATRQPSHGETRRRLSLNNSGPRFGVQRRIAMRAASRTVQRVKGLVPTMKKKLLAVIGLLAALGQAQAGPVAWNVNIGGAGGNVGFGVSVGNLPPPAPVVVSPPVAVCPPPCVAPRPVCPPPVVVMPPPRRHWRRPVFVAPPPMVCAPAVPVLMMPSPCAPRIMARPAFPQPPVMVVRR